jgi:hypothetical protein
MRFSAAGVLLVATLASSSAMADGKRDLEDGIAFYENLDTDRAMERLTRATKAADLVAADKAKAFLYLGMLQFEIGSTSDAKKSWTEALKLKPDIQAPEGTSPKTIEAIEETRSKLSADPGGPKIEPPPTAYEPPPPPVEDAPDEPKETPDIAPPPPPLADAVVAETAPPAEGSSNLWLWVGIGAGAAALVAAAIAVGVVVGGGNGSECGERGGGCLGVSFQ